MNPTNAKIRRKKRNPLCCFLTSLKKGKNFAGMFIAPKEAKLANKKDALIIIRTNPTWAGDSTNGYSQRVLI